MQVDDVLAMLGQHFVHRGDGEDAVDGVAERLARVDVVGAGLQPQQRGHGLQVVLDAMVDLLGEHAAQGHAPTLERDRRVVPDRLEQLPVLGREWHVAVDHQLTDPPALPAERQPDGVRAGPPLGPRDASILEHERRPRRLERLDRRLDDLAERLLEVERLGDGLRDPRERLELAHPPLRVLVELGVLDRPRDLRGDRHEELDLGVGEGTRLAGTHVERALERVTGENRHGEDRLVLVLAQVRRSA